MVDDVTQALSDDGKISGGEWLALGADVIFLGLDVVAAGDIIKAVKVAKVANTEAKAAKRWRSRQQRCYQEGDRGCRE